MHDLLWHRLRKAICRLLLPWQLEQLELAPLQGVLYPDMVTKADAGQRIHLRANAKMIAKVLPQRL